MTIQAYTFEAANVDGSQITPYSAKVDARVRRDMFHGEGNLIIPGMVTVYLIPTVELVTA